MFLGTCLSGTMFAICCIRGDAYISFHEKPRSYAATLGIESTNWKHGFGGWVVF